MLKPRAARARTAPHTCAFAVLCAVSYAARSAAVKVMPILCSVLGGSDSTAAPPSVCSLVWRTMVRDSAYSSGVGEPWPMPTDTNTQRTCWSNTMFWSSGDMRRNTNWPNRSDTSVPMGVPVQHHFLVPLSAHAACACSVLGVCAG